MRGSSATGRRSGEIRYHLDQETVHATTKGTQNPALTALPTGQHGSRPCCHQATVRSWWAGTQLTVAPSGLLRRRRTGVERSQRPVGYSSPLLRCFELLPLPLSGPPRNLLEDSLSFPGRQPCEAIAIDRIEDIELGDNFTVCHESIYTKLHADPPATRLQCEPVDRNQHTARCKPGPAALPRERPGQHAVGLQTSSKSHRVFSVCKGQALALAPFPRPLSRPKRWAVEGPRLVPQTARVGSVSEMPCPHPHPHPHPARAVGSGPS